MFSWICTWLVLSVIYMYCHNHPGHTSILVFRHLELVVNELNEQLPKASALSSQTVGLGAVDGFASELLKMAPPKDPT